uniref:Arrestin-like N-terminal domain-containing protein n=1 Tax=Cacopsylla melanoneura TaxID=428564 RepID=A0A8D8VAG8_9HEMI
MKEFRIEFDSPTSAYYAGQIVSGRVILNLQDKPKKVRAVTIQFKGESKVEFSGQETVRKDNGDTANENVQFKSTEEYYDFKYNLLGGSQGIYVLCLRNVYTAGQMLKSHSQLPHTTKLYFKYKVFQEVKYWLESSPMLNALGRKSYSKGSSRPKKTLTCVCRHNEVYLYLSN